MEELREVLIETKPWYQGLDLEETKNILRANVVTVARSVIAIGYYLKHIRDNELYIQDGYSSLPEFAKEEFGLSKSAVSRYMSINNRFSKGGNSPVADDRYQGFGKGQLQEMLSLTDEQLVQVEPTMQVMDIRELGKQLEGGQLPGQMMITDFPQFLPEGYSLGVDYGAGQSVSVEMSIDDLLGGSMPEPVSVPERSALPASFTMTVDQLMGETPEVIAISQQAEPEDYCNLEEQRIPQEPEERIMHELKTVPPYFQAIWDGVKEFELRRDDREFKAGDYLMLREYIPSVDTYTCRCVCVEVKYILRDCPAFGLQEGYCILGFERVL